MKVISLNTGRSREYVWNGKVVTTGIFKTPVAERRRVHTLNVEGDEQADLRVHGGVDKAVYAYDISHYDYWKRHLERDDWSPGLFGENLTTGGLPDDAVRIGDIYRAGTARLMAVQPRFPCFKLNLRFGLPDMIERFNQHGRHGIYFRVVGEGDIATGDALELIERSPHDVTVHDVAACFAAKGADREMVGRMLALTALPEGLKDVFRRFIG